MPGRRAGLAGAALLAALAAPRLAAAQQGSCGTVDETSDTFASCTCDLTANNCDQNCCCDPDCSAADKQAFTGCTLTKLGTHRRCVYKVLVARNNTQFTVDTTDSDLFCVLVDNNDGRTYFEQPCSPATEAQFAALAASTRGANFSYLPGDGSTTLALPVCVAVSQAGLQGCSTRSASPAGVLNGTAAGGYVYDGVIYTAYELTGSPSVSYAYGVLTLAQPATSGECTDDSPAGFGVNARHTCARRLNLAVTTGRDACAAGVRSAFEAASYLEPALYLAPNTDAYATRALAGGVASDANTVAITCESVTVRSAADGSEVVHACTGATNASSFELACNASAAEFPVVEVHYTVNRSASTIVGASARFVVLDALASGSLPRAVQQTVSITFVSGSAASAAAVYPRSGNPGYLAGKPVLAGQSVSGGGAVNLSTSTDDWLWLPRPGSSSLCSDVDVTRAASRSSVVYGFDAVTSCTIEVTVENYTDTAACNGLRAAAAAAVRAAVNTNNRVGMYGNSNPSTADDWVEVLDSDPSGWGAAFSGTDTNYECTQVVVGLRLELLTAKIGNVDNAQSTIVGARYVPVFRTEAFTCTSYYCDTSLAASARRQVLPVTFTVSFLDVTQRAEGVNEHQPDVIRKLPTNFFYPFD